MQCNLCGTRLPDGSRPRWRKDGFEIVACPSCGLLFRAEFPRLDEVGDIYGDDYFRRRQDDDTGQGYADYVGEEDLHRLNARRRLDRIERSVEPGHLLDVGCASGFFLDEARRRGWRVSGIDVSPAMTELGRSKLGLDIQTGVLRRGSYAADTFDCVTMWDYIEHSVDPAADLAIAHDVLRPGGRLFLSTGDAGSVVARASGRRWHLLTPRHHNFFFTVETLRAYVTGSGFTVTEARHFASWYSLYYLLYKLRTMLPGNRALARLGDWVGRNRAGRLAVPVNLWDIVTLGAHKPVATSAAGAPSRSGRQSILQ